MTDYGLTICRKKLGLQPSMGIIMMRTRLLQLTPVIRKERGSLSRKTTSEKITQRYNALAAKNLVMLNNIALRKRVNKENPKLRLMMRP